MRVTVAFDPILRSPRPVRLLAAFQAAAQAALLGALGALLLALLLFLGPLGALERQADLPLVAVDAEDLDVDLLADLQHVLGLLDLLVARSREMCSRPSRPGSSSTNTPKLAIFVTWPLTTMPGR